MIHYEPITRENIDYAVRLHRELFPEYSARVNYEESISGVTDYEYYLVCDGTRTVGISGIYHYAVDPESAWLGWFGILDPFRRKGYGSATIRIFESMAVSRGYRFARLYTDRDDNETAIAFYKANGYTPEVYLTDEDPISAEVPVLIFSKSLDGSPLVPWDNRCIGLTEQAEKQIIDD